MALLAQVQTLRGALFRCWRRLRGVNERCVELKPSGEKGEPSRGRVLLSYVIDGVLEPDDQQVSHAHPHFWETRAMASVLVEAGYAVDVVHWTRRRPPPRRDYDVYIDVRRNFDRYHALLPSSCLRIAHMDTAHHRVHNNHQQQRLEALRQRRGIVLKPFKLVEANRADEHADLITILGNDFTRQTYAHAGKPIHRIRLSNAFEYPFPEHKDFSRARRHFMWLGSEGFVHKGLDLVLEAFAQMPDVSLTVCGPLEREPDFVAAFGDLLYDTPNIKVEGWMDVASPRFRECADACLGIVYPSCSEGGGGCVITAMHAGLIPVVSREASVDVDPDFGVTLETSSVEAVIQAVSELAERNPADLQQMARKAWMHVREHHTRERFKDDYRAFVAQLDASIAAKRKTNVAVSERETASSGKE